MALPTVSPRAYQRITLVAAWSLAAIIVTGAFVRLSGSGLGCPDWPACEKNSLVAELSWHQMVEFVNRVITGIVSVAVIVAVLGSVRRRPFRPDLVWLSVSLVIGVLAQIGLGGITVLTHLNPIAVQGHFVVSIAVLTAAVVLHHRAGEDGAYHHTTSTIVRRLAWAVTVLSLLAIVTGTVVTGTGPHGGDETAHRFDFQITTVARIHSITVLVTVAAALLVAYCAHVRHRDWAAVGQPLIRFIWVAVAQGIVGYTQYFNDVPVGLVAIHVVGAVSVWVAALLLGLATRAAAVTSVEDGVGVAERHAALLGADHLHQDAVEADRVLQVRQVLEP
jgi:cytochrome c oxidase assembly protein subunit 15